MKYSAQYHVSPAIFHVLSRKVVSFETVRLTYSHAGAELEQVEGEHLEEVDHLQHQLGLLPQVLGPPEERVRVRLGQDRGQEFPDKACPVLTAAGFTALLVVYFVALLGLEKRRLCLTFKRVLLLLRSSFFRYFSCKKTKIYKNFKANIVHIMLSCLKMEQERWRHVKITTFSVQPTNWDV